MAIKNQLSDLCGYTLVSWGSIRGMKNEMARYLRLSHRVVALVSVAACIVLSTAVSTALSARSGS